LAKAMSSETLCTLVAGLTTSTTAPMASSAIGAKSLLRSNDAEGLMISLVSVDSAGKNSV
jgi:hypothetical protein